VIALQLRSAFPLTSGDIALGTHPEDILEFEDSPSSSSSVPVTKQVKELDYCQMLNRCLSACSINSTVQISTNHCSSCTCLIKPPVSVSL
jgi:hypothetical protein